MVSLLLGLLGEVTPFIPFTRPPAHPFSPRPRPSPPPLAPPPPPPTYPPDGPHCSPAKSRPPFLPPSPPPTPSPGPLTPRPSPLAPHPRPSPPPPPATPSAGAALAAAQRVHGPAGCPADALRLRARAVPAPSATLEVTRPQANKLHAQPDALLPGEVT